MPDVSGVQPCRTPLVHETPGQGLEARLPPLRGDSAALDNKHAPAVVRPRGSRRNRHAVPATRHAGPLLPRKIISRERHREPPSGGSAVGLMAGITPSDNAPQGAVGQHLVPVARGPAGRAGRRQPACP
jgi:hypothetical protein